MHAALKLNETLREIFGHIYGTPDAKRDLYHAALVCKPFLPHALDVLWYSIDTLRHLIALIPHTSTDTSLLAFTGTRLLTKDDLSHFDLHALRVHELELAPTHAIRVPVMMQLLDCLGRQNLLPRLRVLRLGAYAKELNEADCFFLGPNLRSLEIQHSDINYFFPRVIQMAPSLRHLKLPYQAIPTHLIPLTRCLRQLETLETENKFVISSNSLFPFPEQLKTWRASSIISCSREPSSLKSTQFPALTTLELTDQLPADDIAGLLSQSIFPKLVNVIIVAPSYSKENVGVAQFKDSWFNLCKYLFSNPRQFVQIHGNCLYYTVGDAIRMDLADFFTLTERQTTLRTFWIAEPKLLKPLTRASIDRLCTTFPFLTDLYIQLEESSLISFDDLVVLADQLPLLRCLDIGINGTDLADPPSVPILSHNLGKLGIESSSIPNPFLFTRYIDRLFPFAQIQDIVSPSKDEESVISAHKLAQGCRRDQEERGVQKSVRKRQTARRGRM